MTLFTSLYRTSFLPNDRLVWPSVIRYYDLVQHLVHQLAPNDFDLLTFDLSYPFTPLTAAPKPKEQVEPAKEKAGKEKDGTEKDGKEKPAKVAKEPKEAAPAKKQVKEAQEKPSDKVDPSKLDLRVGKIVAVKRHPDAESLYVEEVELNEGQPRTVVSGLVKYMKEEDLLDKMVVLVCNLKPAKMRGIESQAMVLAANSADGQTVELVQPPAGSKPGDKATFKGFDGEPEKLLNPKRKIWEGIQPNLLTNGSTEATFVDPTSKTEALLLVNGQACKVASLKGASIK